MKKSGKFYVKPAILYCGEKNSGKTACEVSIGQCFTGISKLKKPIHYILSFDGVTRETVRFTCGSPANVKIRNFLVDMDSVKSPNDPAILGLASNVAQKAAEFLNKIAENNNASVITLEAMDNIQKLHERAMRFKKNYAIDRSLFKDFNFYSQRNNLTDFLFFKAQALARDAVQCSSYFSTKEYVDPLVGGDPITEKFPNYGTARIEQVINVVLNPIMRIVKKKPEYSCLAYSSKIPPLFRPAEILNMTGVFGNDGYMRITPFQKIKPILTPRLKNYNLGQKKEKKRIELL